MNHDGVNSFRLRSDARAWAMTARPDDSIVRTRTKRTNGAEYAFTMTLG